MMDVAKEQVALCRSTVSGSIFEKIFFYLLIICSLVIFALSAIGLIIDARDATITNVTFVRRDTFDFPGMFFCYEHQSSKIQVKNGPGSVTYSPGNLCQGLQETEAEWCVINNLGIKQEDIDGWSTMQMAGEDFSCSEMSAVQIRYNSSLKATSRKCIPLMLEDTEGVSESELKHILDLRRYVNNIANADVFRCAVLNHEGSVQASRDDAQFKLVLEVSVQPGGLGFFFAGFYDQSISVEQMFEENFRFYYIPTLNHVSDISFTKDIIEDVSDTLHWSPPAFGNEEKQRKDYRAVMSGASFDTGMALRTPNEYQSSQYLQELNSSYVRTKATLWATENYIRRMTAWPTRSMLQFSVGSFWGRNMHIRKKSLAEIWSELGGCWASAALLITIFFINRSVVLPDSGTTLSTQVLRFRTEHSKKDMLMQLKDYVTENKDTVVGAGDTIGAVASNV